MITSDAFNYINILDRAADASVKRENIIANNIANADTPYYKRQDIAFETVLHEKLFNNVGQTLDQAVANIDVDSLNGIEYFDYDGYSYRIDKNNVDIDTENVELASEQIRYQALTQSISQEFSRFNTVLK